jgi:DNA segregation ATPase FtsK/SpoIIIE-like protein
MKELKERVADELLPRAFSIRSNVWTWIDPVNGWLVIDAASPGKADEVIKLLLKAVDKLPLESLRVERSPVGVMTAWLEADDAPAGFTVDMDTELRATGESKAAVRYVKHSLDPEEVRRNIKAGKQCTRLAMTWDSKISFVLTESLAIKGLKPLDVIAENESAAKDDDERFDADFMLMTGELAKLMADVVEALGGPAQRDAPLTSLPKGDEAVRALKTVRHGRGEVPSSVASAQNSDQGPATTAAGAPASKFDAAGVPPSDGSADDPLYKQAVKEVLAGQKPSLLLVQRSLRVGYSRAERLLETMELAGIVSVKAPDGSRELAAAEAS